MSEKVVKYDEISMECGSFSVRIESIQDLRAVIASKQTSVTLAAEQFDGGASLLSRSRFDYHYSPSHDNVALSGYVEFGKQNSVWSSQQAMTALYEFLVEEIGINECQIDENDSGDATIITVFTDDGVAVNYSYDDCEEGARIFMNAEQTSPSDDDCYGMTADCLRMWGDVHRLALWMNEVAESEVDRHEIVVKKTTQPECGFVLWQAMLDYETWKQDMDLKTLPSFDHTNINVGRVGLALAVDGRDGYDSVMPSIRRMAIAMRQYERTVITEADMVIGLTA